MNSEGLLAALGVPSEAEVAADGEARCEPDDGPFRDRQVHVLARQCSTCIFRRGNPMHLRPGRLKQLVATAVRRGSGIVCHSTLPNAGRRAFCRGFWTRHYRDVPLLRLAVAWAIVRFDEPPPKDLCEPTERGMP